MTFSFADLRRAARHYRGNRHNQEGWLRAVAYLRARGLWVLEGGAAKFHASR